MRITLTLMFALIAGCAVQPVLDPVPPAGVDLSGHWRLNVADSDDPLRIPRSLAANTPGSGQQRGRSSRNGGQGMQGAALPAVAIPTALVADVLRWPGAEVEIHQEGGSASFTSDGDSRLYQPATAARSAAARNSRRGRRSAEPATCGWSGHSLVVHLDAEEDQPGYEARYRLSDDGSRLLQVITLQGGRLTGFTLSRVWERE